jgi:PAS domain S-box-containing protein
MTSADMSEPPDMRKAEQPAAPSGPDLASPLAPRASDRLVVVADDDEGLRWVVCNWLETHGLTTLGVGSGADAVAALQQHPDCLLLLDYFLSDMDGRQFLDKLNALGIAVPFVVMTGNGDERIAVEMMKLGARDYVVKQADFTDLLVPVVERVLAQIATERRLTQAEQALRDSEVKYRVLMDDAPDAILLADEQGYVVEANRQAERLLGLPRADIAKLHVSALNCDGAFADLSARSVDLSKSGRYAVLDTVVVSGDGSEIPVDVTASLVTFGGRAVSQVVLHDITERKRAEEELRASEDRYRDLFENANDIIYTVDLDGNLTGLNRAAELITGYARAEALRMNLSQVVAPEQVEQAVRLLNLAREGVAPPIAEWTVITKDGGRILLEVALRVITEGGKPVGVQGIARDITERKQAEDRIRESQRFLEEIGRAHV